MNSELIGEQLTGQELYLCQKSIRANSGSFFAPIIVADSLHISENIGSTLRIADAVGSKRVIFINHPTDQNITRVRRTARNCDTLVDWEFSTYENFLELYLPSLPALVAVEITSRSKNIFEVCLPSLCTFIIGNERHGISSKLLKLCVQAVHIPMYGINGSMNVTHALAIALYEWRRQHLAAMHLLSNNSNAADG